MSIKLNELEISVLERIANKTLSPFNATSEEMDAMSTIDEKISALRVETNTYDGESALNPCKWLLKKYREQQSQEKE